MNVKLAEILKKLVTDPVEMRGQKKSHSTPRFLYCNFQTVCMPGVYSEFLICGLQITSPSSEFGNVPLFGNIQHVGQIWTQLIHCLDSELLTKTVSAIDSTNRKIIDHPHLVFLGHRKTLGNKALPFKSLGASQHLWTSANVSSQTSWSCSVSVAFLGGSTTAALSPGAMLMSWGTLRAGRRTSGLNTPVLGAQPVSWKPVHIYAKQFRVGHLRAQIHEWSHHNPPLNQNGSHTT